MASAILLFHSETDGIDYFLVPDDLTLPEGPFALRDLAGNEQRVDQTAVSPHQISEETAQEHIKTQLQQGLQQAQNALTDMLILHQEAEAAKPKPSPSPLITDLLGFTPDEARQDPEMAQEKLAALFTDITTFFQNVTSPDPTQVEAAREQMRALRATFAKHGVATNEKMEQLPDKLRQTYQEDQEERRERLSAALQELAHKIQEAGTAVGEQLKQEAEKLQQTEQDDT